MKRISAILILLFVSSGCMQPASKLKMLSLGQTKEDVIASIGDPRVVRGAIQNKYGQNIEVWEYRLLLSSDNAFDTFMFGSASADKRDYWLYFVNDELVKWGQAGDWQKEAQNIYEIRFTSGHNL